MSTIGLRGVLAATFLVSTGLMTGMSTPVGAPVANLEASPIEARDSRTLVDQVKFKTCVVSLAATRRDAAADRREECEQRIASSH